MDPKHGSVVNFWGRAKFNVVEPPPSLTAIHMQNLHRWYTHGALKRQILELERSIFESMSTYQLFQSLKLYNNASPYSAIADIKVSILDILTYPCHKTNPRGYLKHDPTQYWRPDSRNQLVAGIQRMESDTRAVPDKPTCKL